MKCRASFNLIGYLIIMPITFITCSSYLKSENYGKQIKSPFEIVEDKINKGEITFSGGDGLSKSNALIITGNTNEREWEIAQHLFLKKKFKGIRCDFVSHRYSIENDKYYNFIEFRISGNSENTIYYFDKSVYLEELKKEIDDKKYDQMIIDISKEDLRIFQ
jgi:hypothetical protein